jgi:RNA polymerase sigma-70 factor (ECF subfamily)
MSGELEEQTLILSAQAGDPEAFNLLIERYQALLFRIALRMLGDEDNAADATQVAWISAYRKINKFHGEHLRTWLARVVVNACYDEIRRRHRRCELPLWPVSTEGEEIDASFSLADPAPGVEEMVDRDEFEKMMHESLLSLTPVYRAMLVLVDIEGLSYEEAAGAARVPVGTVRSRLARARMALRQRLHETADLLPACQRFQILPTRQVRLRCP